MSLQAFGGWAGGRHEAGDEDEGDRHGPPEDETLEARLGAARLGPPPRGASPPSGIPPGKSASELVSFTPWGFRWKTNLSDLGFPLEKNACIFEWSSLSLSRSRQLDNHSVHAKVQDSFVLTQRQFLLAKTRSSQTKDVPQKVCLRRSSRARFWYDNWPHPWQLRGFLHPFKA